jgi:hypothetical protein
MRTEEVLESYRDALEATHHDTDDSLHTSGLPPVRGVERQEE